MQHSFINVFYERQLYSFILLNFPINVKEIPQIMRCPGLSPFRRKPAPYKFFSSPLSSSAIVHLPLLHKNSHLFHPLPLSSQSTQCPFAVCRIQCYQVGDVLRMLPSVRKDSLCYDLAVGILLRERHDLACGPYTVWKAVAFVLPWRLRAITLADAYCLPSHLYHDAENSRTRFGYGWPLPSKQPLPPGGFRSFLSSGAGQSTGSGQFPLPSTVPLGIMIAVSESVFFYIRQRKGCCRFFFCNSPF